MKLKPLYLLVLLSFFNSITKGQAKYTDTSKYNSYWMHSTENIQIQLSLSNIRLATNKFYWRLWSYTRIFHSIDLYKDKNSKLKGFISFYAKEFVDLTHELPTNRFFHYTVNLTPDQALKIYTLINKLEIDQLPTDRKIKGWELGFDGDEYIIEQTNNTIYSYKCYWTPRIQTITEGVLLNEFLMKVDTIAELKTDYINYLKRVPFESYTTDNGYAYTRPLTNKQREEYRKERDRYRKKHHIK